MKGLFVRNDGWPIGQLIQTTTFVTPVQVSSGETLQMKQAIIRDSEGKVIPHILAEVKPNGLNEDGKKQFLVKPIPQG